MEGPVLLVESDPEWRKNLEERLERADFLTIVHDNPTGAMKEIEQGLQYRLALVDLDYSGQRYTGLDVSRASKDKNPMVPVIFISKYPSPIPESDAFWTKSKDVSKLLDIVKSLLDIAKSRH